MILPVYVYGWPILRKKAVAVDKDYPGLDVFIADMWETMYKSDGVGLAAPQVGKSIRIFVIDASALDEEDTVLQNFKKAFINPEILEESGEDFVYQEGCLSLPTIREDVTRPSKVKIRYYDEEWQLHEEEYDGIAARVIQHEYDHLEGIMFIDKIPFLRRRLLNSKLTAVSKGKVECAYKIKLPK
jgi:peptide deformylase